VTEDERRAPRRLVGLVMAGSAVILGLVGGLVLGAVLPVAEPSRMLVGSVLVLVAALDLLAAAYFIISSPS
jgi:hypothetical protein